MPELVVFLRSREVGRTPILQSETTIGRDQDADVVIDNPGVSRTHAVVAFTDGAFVVRDAGSQNGITVNGRKVREAPLSDGDIVGVNKFKIHFRLSGGVPAEMLAAPTRQVGGEGGKNVVATMNVDAAAAVRMQQEFLRKRQAEIQAQQRAAAPSHGWVWYVAVLAFGVSGVAMYLALR